MIRVRVIDLNATLIDEVETETATEALEWMDEVETRIDPAQVGQVEIWSDNAPISVEALVALAEFD